MSAALSASDETVSSLLSWGASPDKTNANGRTALIFAIESKCLTTITLLAPVTQAKLGRALEQLVRKKVELTIEQLRSLLGCVSVRVCLCVCVSVCNNGNNFPH